MHFAHSSKKKLIFREERDIYPWDRKEWTDLSAGFFLRNSGHSGFASDFAGHLELLLSFVNISHFEYPKRDKNFCRAKNPQYENNLI